MNTELSTEIALQQREAEFKALADNAPVWIIRIDTNGIIEYINHVLPEYDKEEVIGTSVYNYILPESQEVYKKNIEEALSQKNTVYFDLESAHSLGHHYHYEVHMAPIITDEVVNGLVVISTDVTEKVHAKQKLERALKEKEALLKEVHHRAKNNLQIISSILNLQSKKSDDKRVLTILSESKNSIQSLALVHECLYKSNDFSKVSLNDYFDRFCYHFKNTMLTSSNIQLKVEMREVISANMDKAITCGLILNELLTNAYKHAFPTGEGEIRVDLYKVEDKVTIKVEDNGIGIKKEVLEDRSSFGFDLIDVLCEQLDGATLSTSTSVKGTKHLLTSKYLNS
jgi:PAS domain S-box-containing protein